MLEAVGGVADRLAAIGRREQDRLAADDLGERGACRLDAGRPRLLVEEAVHPRDPGRHDALLRDPERLGVERHVELGADDRGRVVLVGPAERIEVAGLAGTAVADGLERARGVPQLDDPDVLVQLDPVERRERVVEQDHVGPGERAGQAKAVAERPALGDPRLEHGQQIEVAVEPALDHPIVDDPEVARHLRDEPGREQHPPAAAPGEQLRGRHEEAEDRSPDPGGGPLPDRLDGGRVLAAHVLVVGDVEREGAVGRAPLPGVGVKAGTTV